MKTTFIYCLALITFLLSNTSTYAAVSPSTAAFSCENIRLIDRGKTKEECDSSKGGCFVDGKCYLFEYLGLCECVKQGGSLCSAEQPGGFFTVCKWEDKGCDSWHLYHKQCSKETAVSLKDSNGEVYCRLLGGKVVGNECQGVKKWLGNTPPNCPLHELWEQTCPVASMKHHKK